MSFIYKDFRRECGKIVRNKYGQYFYICCTCFCEFLSSESFRKHQTAHEVPVSTIENPTNDAIARRRFTKLIVPVKPTNEKNKGAEKKKDNYAIARRRFTQLIVPKPATPKLQRKVTLKKLESVDASPSSSTVKNEILPGKYKCKVCSYKFDSLIDLDSHGEQCLGKARKKCDFCVKTFETTTGLRLHTRKQHESELPFICNVCPKGFNHRYELELHKRQHDNNPWIRCDFCDKQLRSGYEKDNHVKLWHPFATYMCKSCSYQCKSEATMRRHQCCVLDVNK